MRIRGLTVEVVSNGWVHIALPGASPAHPCAITVSPKEWAAIVASVGEEAEKPPLAPT